MTKANLILPLVPMVFQIWLAVLLVQKKEHRRFPFFAVYTMYSILAAVIRPTLAIVSYPAYVLAYWLTEAVFAALGLLAMYEAFKEVFWSLLTVWWFRLLVPLMAVIALTLALAKEAYRPPIQIYQFGALVLSGEIALRYLQGSIFALFLALSRFFHVRVGRYAGGILDGFGIVAVGIPVSVSLGNGRKINIFFSFVPVVAYIIGSLVWLVSFRGEEEPEDSVPVPKSQLLQVRDEIRRYLKLTKRFRKP